MNNEEKTEDLPIPLQDFLYVKPYEKKSILVSDKNSLQTYGIVCAKGEEATHVKIGDYVAFEFQDKPEFISIHNEMYNFVKEKDCMCILPANSPLFFYQ